MSEGDALIVEPIPWSGGQDLNLRPLGGSEPVSVGGG